MVPMTALAAHFCFTVFQLMQMYDSVYAILGSSIVRGKCFLSLPAGPYDTDLS